MDKLFHFVHSLLFVMDFSEEFGAVRSSVFSGDFEQGSGGDAPATASVVFVFVFHALSGGGQLELGGASAVRTFHSVHFLSSWFVSVL